MTAAQRHHLSTMDPLLSRDPVLAALPDLFATSALPAELVELPPPPPIARRQRRTIRTPECISIAAALVLVGCLVFGCVFHSGVIALSGLAVTLLLGLGCWVALKRGRSAAPVGSNVRR
ncbi:MAG TPA: hypothetical protein VGN81_34780 [Pseudonocardiaceae bacterium]|jgi:hypothetical protein